MNNEINLLYILLAIYAVVNLVSFIVMLIDKNQSRKDNKKRISEAMMFFLSVMFGALGVYAGMFAVRHKTQKIIFIVGIPMIMIQNISFLYVLYIIFQALSS